jgi:hypothetical protein
MGLEFKAGRDHGALETDLAGRLPAEPEQFTNVIWVSFVGFETEIKDFDFLSMFPKLNEIRFENSNVLLDGIPDNIKALRVENSSLQRPERSMRLLGFDKIHITPIVNNDAYAIGEHHGLKDLIVTSLGTGDMLEAENWRNLDNLTRLDLNSIPFQSLSFFPHVTALRHLKLSNIGLLQLGVLRGLPLETLSWSERDHPKRFNGLDPEDVAGLETLTALKSLSINDGIPDLTPLQNMHQMEHLDLNLSSADLSVLGHMPNLKSVTLSIPDKPDLASLENCTRLSKLRLTFKGKFDTLDLGSRKAIREHIEQNRETAPTPKGRFLGLSKLLRRSKS